MRFSYDEKGVFGLDSTCFATGADVAYICCILNSIMGHYLLKDSPKTGTGDLLVSVQAIEPIKVPYSLKEQTALALLLKQNKESINSSFEEQINTTVFSLYGLSSEEITYVTDYVIQSQQSQ